MSTSRRVSLWGALAMFLIGVCFFGWTFLSGQGKGQGKPDPKYTWQVEIMGIPDGSSTLFPDANHSTGVYFDAESSANVTTGYMTYIRTKFKETWYTPWFRFEVIPGAQVEFRNIYPHGIVGGEPIDSPPYTPFSGGGFGVSGQDGLFKFINDVHPQPGYSKVLFVFSGSSKLNLDEADFTKMTPGEVRKIKMDLYITGQDIYGDCSQCNPAMLHNIQADAFPRETTPGFYDLYLTRTGDNTWSLKVDTNFDNSNYLPDPTVFDYNDGRIYQEYCECIPVKVRNRTTLEKKTIRPYWAQTHMKFELVFTRTTL